MHGVLQPLRGRHGVAGIGPHGGHLLQLLVGECGDAIGLHGRETAKAPGNALHILFLGQQRIGRDGEGRQHGGYGGVDARHEEGHPHAANAHNGIEGHVLNAQAVGRQHHGKEAHAHGHVGQRYLGGVE